MVRGKELRGTDDACGDENGVGVDVCGRRFVRAGIVVKKWPLDPYDLSLHHHDDGVFYGCRD